MFSLNGVTLRPLEFDDIDTLYEWDSDTELSIYAGWVPARPRAAYRQRYEKRITEPEDDLYMFGIEVDTRLVGHVQLAEIDQTNRRAAVGILIGEKDIWGHGIGGTALRILLDYAFTVRALERIYAEVYSFNTRSQRLMKRVGFQQEGILRQHEFHNGSRQDMYTFGILKSEFYQHYETIFKLAN
ncbi:MAG: GNAT family N-acetyltransferase [Chloroflexota bacterium]|nr:GNAT family N-acetyltransferase [Chloroflexota bacterium]